MTAAAVVATPATLVVTVVPSLEAEIQTGPMVGLISEEVGVVCPTPPVASSGNGEPPRGP